MVSTFEEYRTDNITVIVEWTKVEGVSYNISTVPTVPMIYTGSTSVQLIVSYNTEYSVSLEAATVCQRVAVSHIQLFYGELQCHKHYHQPVYTSLINYLYIANCGIFLSVAHHNNPNVTYSGLPIEGTIANFSCPPGMIPNGTNATICTRNGEWEPDPQGVYCVEGLYMCVYL